MENQFVLENIQRIYDLDTGMYIELAPDDEGLGLIQLNCYDEKNKCYTSLKLTAGQMPLLKKAIEQLGY